MFLLDDNISSPNNYAWLLSDRRSNLLQAIVVSGAVRVSIYIGISKQTNYDLSLVGIRRYENILFRYQK